MVVKIFLHNPITLMSHPLKVALEVGEKMIGRNHSEKK
jgi:hypothetical protein